MCCVCACVGEGGMNACAVSMCMGEGVNACAVYVRVWVRRCEHVLCVWVRGVASPYRCDVCFGCVCSGVSMHSVYVCGCSVGYTYYLDMTVTWCVCA